MLEKSAISHQPHSCSEVSAARKTSSTAASFSLTVWTQFGVKRSNHPGLGYPMTHKNGGSLRNRMLNCQENNTYASLSQHHKIYQLVHIYVHSTSTPPPATKQPTTSPYGTRLVGWLACLVAGNGGVPWSTLQESNIIWDWKTISWQMTFLFQQAGCFFARLNLP